jgi:DHHC palmitoyltransferase
MCNKCVERYDHHCIFMSTCVGRKNYKQFLVAVTIAAIVGTYFGTVAIYGFVVYFSDRQFFYSRRTFLIYFSLASCRTLVETE